MGENWVWLRSTRRFCCGSVEYDINKITSFYDRIYMYEESKRLWYRKQDKKYINCLYSWTYRDICASSVLLREASIILR